MPDQPTDNRRAALRAELSQFVIGSSRKVITGGSPAAAVRQVGQIIDGEIASRVAKLRSAEQSLAKGANWKSIAAMHDITRARYKAETGAINALRELRRTLDQARVLTPEESTILGEDATEPS